MDKIPFDFSWAERGIENFCDNVVYFITEYGDDAALYAAGIAALFLGGRYVINNCFRKRQVADL
jgi:hypothetical protein